MSYAVVPPSGGSLEIGNFSYLGAIVGGGGTSVPPSGGSLEIGNEVSILLGHWDEKVPPSGGSLEIGNSQL